MLAGGSSLNKPGSPLERGSKDVADVRCQEFGILVGLMNIMVEMERDCIGVFGGVWAMRVAASVVFFMLHNLVSTLEDILRKLST